MTLDVQMDPARLEDVLRMAVKTPHPPMTGALRLTTTFVLPPGDREVVQKLRLDGTFAIADTRFADSEVQAKITELSHRTQGRTPDQQREHVSSHFAGTFMLANSRLAIPDLAFDVPGSAIRLSGSYGLVSERGLRGYRIHGREDFADDDRRETRALEAGRCNFQERRRWSGHSHQDHGHAQ